MSPVAYAGPPVGAEELAERFGTPLYVFDGTRLAQETAAFQRAWGPGVTVAYSLKSNPLIIDKLNPELGAKLVKAVADDMKRAQDEAAEKAKRAKKKRDKR